MYPKAVQYNDVLVNNLVSLGTINALLYSYADQIDPTDTAYQQFINTKRGDILFFYVKLANTPMHMKEARLFASGMNKPAETSKERLYGNAQNVLDYIHASYQSEQFSLVLLSHFNKLFLDSIRDIWDIEKFIVQPNDMEMTYELPIMKIGIPHQKIGEYMHGLDTYYAVSHMPLALKNISITNTLFHSPVFAIANDPSISALLYFLMLKDGFYPYINYFKCIKHVIDTATKEDKFFTLFPELFLHELVQEMQELQHNLASFIHIEPTEHTKYIDLNTRQIKGLSYLKEKSCISREMYARLNNVSTITSYRDLSDMLKKGYLKTTGIGKGTKYVLLG